MLEIWQNLHFFWRKLFSRLIFWTHRLGPIDWPMSVRSSVRSFSQKPVIGSFRNLAWSWRTIVGTNWQSRIFREKSGSFNNYKNVFKNWVFWLFPEIQVIDPMFLLLEMTQRSVGEPLAKTARSGNIWFTRYQVMKFHYWMILTRFLLLKSLNEAENCLVVAYFYS